MTFNAQPAQTDPIASAVAGTEIDLECTHKVIHTLVEVLQHNFKEDTHYLRPLMPPQANVLFVLDKDAANNMAVYMTAKLKELGNFLDGEFRFTLKSGHNGEILQRLRLEFPEGVNTLIIRKMIAATGKLAHCAHS